MTDIKSLIPLIPLIKVPLIVAAVIVVARVALEQVGAPEALNQVFGVAWLYFLVPFYFANRIAKANEPKPYLMLLKTLAVFALISRIFIAPTYWLAYALSWTAPRFSPENGGVVGPDVSALDGYLLIPFRNGVIWTVAATVVGMALGGIALAVMKKRAPATGTT